MDLLLIATTFALGGLAFLARYYDAMPPTFSLSLEWMRNFIGTRVGWLRDAAVDIADPTRFREVRRCISGPTYKGSHMHRGIVVLLHGVNSSWWQWRNIARRLMAEPALADYAFYVPTLVDRGNTDPLLAAQPVADAICMAISQLDHAEPVPFDVVIIGTSMGARIAAHVEVILTTRVRNDWIGSFVFASVAGFFGPAPSAQFAARLGLSTTWVGYHPHAADAAVSQAPHDALVHAWTSARSHWRQSHYHFFASSGDELLPISSTVPIDILPRTVVRDVDHAGAVDGLADHYIPWIVNTLSNASTATQ